MTDRSASTADLGGLPAAEPAEEAEGTAEAAEATDTTEAAEAASVVSVVSLEFAAFCELHHPRYLSYARVWFDEPTRAAAVVKLALDEMATVWPELLGSPNPAAAAWQILRGTVAQAVSGQATLRGDRPVPADEDLAILHYVLGLATPEIADVVGADRASIASQLRRALRQEATGW